MKIAWFIILWSFADCCHTDYYVDKEYIKASKKVISAINEIEQNIEKLNRTLIFPNSTKKPDGSAKAYLKYLEELYNAYQHQLNETIHIIKVESETNVVKNKLFQVTSTTLRPGWEKYYDNSKETTTTPYPPLLFSESDYQYQLKRLKYYEEALKEKEMEAQKISASESFFSDENYFEPEPSEDRWGP